MTCYDACKCSAIQDHQQLIIYVQTWEEPAQTKTLCLQMATPSMWQIFRSTQFNYNYGGPDTESKVSK